MDVTGAEGEQLRLRRGDAAVERGGRDARRVREEPQKRGLEARERQVRPLDPHHRAAVEQPAFGDRVDVDVSAVE